MNRPRRPQDPFAAAEAAFRKAPAMPAPEPAKAPATPGARQTVSLRLDETVLDYFQADGPGWQDRINDALKALVEKVAGVSV